MQHVLANLRAADYVFLAEVIRSNVNLTDDTTLARFAREYADSEQAANAEATSSLKAKLDSKLEKEIRYLGSSDIAYMFRYFTGTEPGVPFRETIKDSAKALKVPLRKLGTDEETLRELVTTYATREFGRLTPDEQQELLVSLGVEREKAAKFVMKSAGVFAMPLLIQAFNTIVVEGLIKQVIFGTIAKLIGSQLSRKLFLFLAGRFPWWVQWIGPAAWAGSIGWTVVDLQGPALRKTIPVVLYLGLCSIREHPEAWAAEFGEPDGSSG